MNAIKFFFSVCCCCLGVMLRAAPAHTHKVAHPAAACAASLNSCPPEGCGGGDPKLNVKKNRTDAPAETPESWTFDEILHLEAERPSQWSEGQDRTEVEELGEDTPIMLSGYLLGAPRRRVPRGVVIPRTEDAARRCPAENCKSLSRKQAAILAFTGVGAREPHSPI